MFQDLKISTKLLLGFLTISVFTLVVGSIGFYFIRQLDEVVAQTRVESEHVISAKSLRLDFLFQFSSLEEYLSTQDPQHLSVFYVKNKTIESAFVHSEAKNKVQGDFKGFFSVGYNVLYESGLEIIKVINSGELEIARETYETVLLPQVKQFDDRLRVFVQNEELHLEMIQISARKTASQATWVALLSVVFIFIVSLFFGLRVSNSIRSSIAVLQKAIEEIGAGNLKYQIRTISKDEIGAVSLMFNKMTRSVRVMRQELKDKLTTITDLAEELRKFQLAVSGVSDYITISTPDMNMLYANKAVEHFTGCSRKQLIGKPLLCTKKVSAAKKAEIFKVLMKNKSVFKGELEGERKDGEKYISEVHIVPLLDDNMDVKFLVEIDRDITRAKAVERMKTEFVTLASHQLRTPLSAIKWLLEMLSEGEMGKLTTDQQEIVLQALESNGRMVMLVNNLLNIARVDEGTLTLDPEVIDLSKFANGILSDMDPLIKEKSQSVDFQCVNCGDKDPDILADKNVLTQVLQNLFSNSVKYTPENGKIAVKIVTNTKYVKCEIADNGIGIPKSEQHRVFQQFFRATNVTKTDTQGSGLGLYIVKLMVEVSGGKMGFKSSEKGGTVFWFKWPKAVVNGKSNCSRGGRCG